MRSQKSYDRANTKIQRPLTSGGRKTKKRDEVQENIEHAQKLLEILKTSQQSVKQETEGISGVEALMGRGYLLGIDVGINAMQSLIAYLQRGKQ